jgi:hypothetical protein
MYGRATNIAKKMAESENKNRIKELVRKSLMQEVDIEVGADRYEAEKDLSQTSAMMDELESLLKGFDWYYYMSDDPRVYRRWGSVDTQISDLVRKLKDMGYGEDAKSLYNQYAPDGDISMKMKEGKKEDVDGDGDIDSKDYLAKRDAAIKKAKGEVDEADMQYINQQREKLKKATDAFEKKKRLRALQQKTAQDKIEPLMREDIDLGHEDNEPHMIKGELYQIGKYAMDLYAIMEELEETGGEYDLPGWWQSKITTAKNMMSSAKHYLDFELKEPAIDAAVDALTGEEPHMGEPEPPMMEAEGTLNQVRNELLGLFQPFGNFQILDMTMKGQNTGTEFRLYSKSKGANWKGLENFMRNNPDFTIKHISKQTFDNPKAIDFSYKKSPMMDKIAEKLAKKLKSK